MSPIEIVRSWIPDIADDETTADAVSRLVRERDAAREALVGAENEAKNARAAEKAARAATIDALAMLGQVEGAPLVPDAPGWWWWRVDAAAGWQPIPLSPLDHIDRVVFRRGGEWGGRCEEPRR